MDFETYLTSKRIDSARFKAAERELWESWRNDFEQMHPNSFTVQKLNLINPIRRKYQLVITEQTKAAAAEVPKPAASPAVKPAAVKVPRPGMPKIVKPVASSAPATAGQAASPQGSSQPATGEVKSQPIVSEASSPTSSDSKASTDVPVPGDASKSMSVSDAANVSPATQGQLSGTEATGQNTEEKPAAATPPPAKPPRPVIPRPVIKPKPKTD